VTLLNSGGALNLSYGYNLTDTVASITNANSLALTSLHTVSARNEVTRRQLWRSTTILSCLGAKRREHLNALVLVQTGGSALGHRFVRRRGCGLRRRRFAVTRASC
jgi:hypothetical protein